MSVQIDRRATEHFPAPDAGAFEDPPAPGTLGPAACLDGPPLFGPSMPSGYTGVSDDDLREALHDGSGRAAQELLRRGVALPTVDRDPVWL